MATFYWEYYGSTGPAWTDMGSNTIVFSGDPADVSVPVTVGAFAGGFHMNNGDPPAGSDQCGTNHGKWVKYVTSGQFDNGSGTETLNFTNLGWNEASIRVRFTDAASVAITSARFYSFDGTTVTTEATGVLGFAWQITPSGTNTWKLINNPASGIGGDNASERLDLLDQAASTEHHYYIATAFTPTSVGAKTAFDFGVALTYS